MLFPSFLCRICAGCHAMSQCQSRRHELNVNKICQPHNARTHSMWLLPHCHTHSPGVTAPWLLPHCHTHSQGPYSRKTYEFCNVVSHKYGSKAVYMVVTQEYLIPKQNGECKIIIQACKSLLMFNTDYIILQ